MKKLNELYLAQPKILRKAERDFVVTFAGLMAASGALDAEYPDAGLLYKAVIAAATLAIWRVARRRLLGPGV